MIFKDLTPLFHRDPAVSPLLLMIKSNWILGVYVLIAVTAVVLDLFVYGLGGAVSLASIPIAGIAMVCFVVSPFLQRTLAKSLFTSWIIGSVLVFAALVYMGTYGEPALKAGKLIFTYATLILAPPASFILPIVSRTTSGFDFKAVIYPSLLGWSACLVAGFFQWCVVYWVMRSIRRRFGN